VNNGDQNLERNARHADRVKVGDIATKSRLPGQAAAHPIRYCLNFAASSDPPVALPAL
jgi:hypothetical protein